MASIFKDRKGYRAQVSVPGTDRRQSKSFRTQREAKAWAAEREAEYNSDAKASELPAGHRTTLLQVLERYRTDVSPAKRGGAWEVKRISAWVKLCELPLDMPVAQVTPEHLSAWRSILLSRVSTGTVLREMGLLSSVFSHARTEWRLIDVNPLADVKRPKMPDHREVVIGWRVVRAMLRALGYSRRGGIRETRQAVAVCFLVALRSGMRAGELTGLTWDRVHDGWVDLPITKTTPRKVPLEPASMRLLDRMRGWDDRMVFGLTAQTLDALFRKYRKRAGLEGFTFHDARHTAATRLSRRLDVLTLCKVFGWKNTKQALTYYNPSVQDIGAMLASRSARRR